MRIGPRGTRKPEWDLVLECEQLEDGKPRYFHMANPLRIPPDEMAKMLREMAEQIELQEED